MDTFLEPAILMATLIQGAVFGLGLLSVLILGGRQVRAGLPARPEDDPADAPAVEFRSRARGKPSSPADEATCARIAEAEIRSRPIGSSDRGLAKLLHEAIADLDGGHRLVRQARLGEVLQVSGDESLQGAIAGKFADFAILDGAGRMVAAIDDLAVHDGAAGRDPVKRQAIRRAGIHFIEIEPDYKPDYVRRAVRFMIAPAAGLATPTHPSPRLRLAEARLS